MNTSQIPRYRSLSATSVPGPQGEDVQSLIEDLRHIDTQSFTTLHDALQESSCLQRLRYTLVDNHEQKAAKDAFRRCRGFQTLLEFLHGLPQIYEVSKLSGEEKKALLAVLKEGLSVLVAALHDHAGNQKYFMNRVNDGGWRALQEILQALSDTVCHDLETANRLLEQFFGALFAAAVGDDSLAHIYNTASKSFDRHTSSSGSFTSNDEKMTVITSSIEKSLVSVALTANPDLLFIVVCLWSRALPRHGAFREEDEVFGLAIAVSLLKLITASSKNLVAAHVAGLLSAVLPLLFDTKRSELQRKILQDLALDLCANGVTTLDDARFLYLTASTSSEAARFVLKAIDAAKGPPNIQFDLSPHGYSSIELSTIGKPFPPNDTGGYTLSVWARFQCFDPRSHTTVFGAFDNTQTCFILAYIEKDTRHLILQTSIRGPKPSVRFRSVTFKADQWYHIAIVHRRPRTTSSSRASLFINGEFAEQLKINYPSVPPVDRVSRTAKVQAFFGTPQDLATSHAKGACTSKWSLASSILFREIFSDDLIAVFYYLGPRYHGNFQDCLGSFQTYQASAALNLRNENLHPGREEQSDIRTAIHKKAGQLIPESSILLNISPTAILDSDDRNNIDESQLIKSLSKQAAKNLQQYMHSGENAVAINGAVPTINEALTQAHGVAILTGEPLVSVPQSLDDASWRLSGCAPIGMNLVHLAKTTGDVATAVEIVFETVRDTWRNSEAMERENGYGVLAALLRDKLAFSSNVPNSTIKSSPAIPTALLSRGQLALHLLRMTLQFVGYDFEQPHQSVINNPLAYRVLLVDTEIWRNADVEAKELYFGQFVTFAVKSQNHRFNARRLARMRVLKKLLDALKSDAVSSETMSLYLTAFRSLIPLAMSSEILRSLALFITYSIHRGSAVLKAKKSLRIEGRPRRSSGSGSYTPDGNLSRFEVGVQLLRFYSDLLCAKGDTSAIKKFAKTVTNKWLLYLMSETSPEVVVLSTRILARLLIIHGSGYVKKFREKSGGFAIMRHRLKRWWHIPALWPPCFAILFDVDIGTLDLERSFDLFGFLDMFGSKDEVKVVYPEVVEVITGMLQNGVKSIINSKTSSSSLTPEAHQPKSEYRQRLSMSTMTPPDPFLSIVNDHHVGTLNTVIRFLADLQTRSASYREFTISSDFVQNLLAILFPVVVGSDTVSADVELSARDSTLTFDGNDVVIRPLSTAPTIMRSADAESANTMKRVTNLRRGSSFVLVASDFARHQLPSSHLQQSVPPFPPVARLPQLNDGHSIVQSLLEIVISVFSEQLLARKDFPGLELFQKTPPGFLEHQTYFESWILRNTLSQLSNLIQLNQKLLLEPKVLTNLARFVTQVGEALYEGWFIGGADAALDFSGSLLEYLQRPDIAKIKSVRLCNQATSVIRAVVFRIVLHSLSQAQSADSLPFLEKLTYWQTILFSCGETHARYLQLICRLLYASLISDQEQVRMAAANLWRIMLVQRPEEAFAVFNHAITPEHLRLASGFRKIVELDNQNFIYWVDEHRENLDSFFFDTLSKSWDDFVAEENGKTEESARQRVAKRREKLKQWRRNEIGDEDTIRRHEVTFDHWTSNIYASEHSKHHRTLQDQQDTFLFTLTCFIRMQRDAKRTVGFAAGDEPFRWRLDQTEGRNRMRLRLIPDVDKMQEEYQPKRKASESLSLRLDTRIPSVSSAEAVGVTPGGAMPGADSPRRSEASSEPFPELPSYGDVAEKAGLEESFELIDDPKEDQDDFEDKNRKVMRSLHHGDQVQHVANVSRIVGLEAVEGLLIVGKDHFYLIDNFLQRADGEIVNVWQASHEEHDPYVRMISGREAVDRKTASGGDSHETRSWKWSDVISVSKRRFLFRDVALEVFFADGRSYLLTVISPPTRNELHSLISARAPQHDMRSGTDSSEHAWRYESLRSPDDEPQTLGSKFAHVFGQAAYSPATRRWQKGEISNFHYLMLINTMAGRTYNDLTQYPVFPWILADYTSEELDLHDPESFRDLSKPMGCQTPEREAEYKERYQSFAEMGDHHAPAFHYGTHYSSAMIVTSYLIRLQPFVKSYLLLQGGTFDHADRMFYSIEKTWSSASRINMTDVRELTPEFFYLPEFLENLNEFDFGTRQNSAQSVNSVELPRWARGDPKIFIAKHRQALESPFVSQNLHKWIDLVFGFKQKGEAAFEAVNVFHHLSYQGARDLDNITDPVERLATIGIIHNFGQTPHQVFQRPHPAREDARHKYKRIDTAAESLTRLPSHLLDSGERVSSLLFSWKQERLLCSAAFRLNMPPVYDKYLEWGFADGSIRFYSAESRRLLGHFEHLHVGQISCAMFADSRTLVTTGTDCTIAVWSLIVDGKSVDLQPRSALFGHRAAVTVMAISRSFTALVTASSDGEVFLWDLNRLEFVGKLSSGLHVDCASINDVTGNIVLCRGRRIEVYTLNADLILAQISSDKLEDIIVSCAFYEGAGNEWLERDILFTGHKGGMVKVWSKVIRNGKFELELIHQLNHLDASREDGSNVSAGISCILLMPQVVYTGDEDGKVVSVLSSQICRGSLTVL